MSDSIKLSDLLAAEEDALLEDGETYEFDVDLVTVKTSRAGRKFLVITLVVAEGAKEGVTVEEMMFWPTGIDDKGLGYFKRKLSAFGLSIPKLIELGIDGEEEFDRLATALEGAPVAGKATVKEKYNSPGEKENGVWLNRSERLDLAKHVQFD